MNEDKKDFVVRDRRIFSDPGAGEEAPEAAEAPEAEPAPEPRAEAGRTRLPEVNFSTFVFSLNSSALVHLGVVADPATGERARNLDFAKQTIDILGMLEEKTRGNLTKDEENLLKNILHDLRLMYVKARS